jgi:tetratricopeptide (TPR) repeat protein/serine/threonine protein kinase
MSEPSVKVDSSLESLVGQVADDFLRRQRDGERPDIEEYIARYPQAAELLRTVLASLRLLDCSHSHHGAGTPQEGPGEVSGTLGDFRIRREVGRGGMGVVYEAVQISLGRPVALKVLPFAAALDARQLQRFKNEAQAAACLHHTNIVPVFAVGCERGVHFYAMQLINGQTLASIIADLRQREDGGEVPDDPQRTSPYPPAPLAAAAGGAMDTPLAQALSTERSTCSQAFYHSVARLGMQAAEALEHAHQFGVVHRDIKPGNLMVDVRGNLWVTDFGLAHIQSDTRLTMTGDLVGTLRYMSPEQALAQRVTIDHRTDIYSLGATLYELLTLKPAFGGRDRQELLRQIAFDEPQAPRRINKGIPVELETVVLKAMAKNPAERYATGQELADDLERFLKDEPIRARRPSLVQRVRRWGRRHRVVVWSAAVGLLAALVVLAGSVGWVVADRSLRREKAVEEADLAWDDVARLRREGKWLAGLAVTRRVQTLLARSGADPQLLHRFTELSRDLQMAADLEGIRFRVSEVKGLNYDFGRADAEYAAAFRAYEIDIDALEADEAASRIASSSVVEELVDALDFWVVSRGQMKQADSTRLLAVARLADPNPQRNQLRDAVESRNRKALVELAGADQGDLPPSTAVFLAVALCKTKASNTALALLLRTQRRCPSDLWVNDELGRLLDSAKPPRLEEATRYYSVALALRPTSPGILVHLGRTLQATGKRDEAIECFRKAIRHDDQHARAHLALGIALSEHGSIKAAIACYKRAVELDPQSADAYSNFGLALLKQGEVEQAIACCKRAIELAPDSAHGYVNLGVALKKQGKVDDSISWHRKAIQAAPTDARAHHCLGLALFGEGRVDEAISSYREAIRLDRWYAPAHVNLGTVLSRKGKLDEAIACYRKAIELDPREARAHACLSAVWVRQGKVEEAISCLRKAIYLDPRFAEAHTDLGFVLQSQGKFEEAIACCNKAIELKPRYAPPHHTLGLIWQARRNLDQAILCYSRAIKINPRAVNSYMNLGCALSDKEQLEDAIACFRKTIELNPGYAEAHANLGFNLSRKGHPDEAIACYRKAIDLNPRLTFVHFRLGYALQVQGKMDDAITSYRKAIELDQKFVPARGQLGRALIQQGRFREGQQAFRRCLDLLSPNDPKRATYLELLRQSQVSLDADGKLTAFLTGKGAPADAGSQVQMAHLALQPFRQYYLASVRLYRDAFARQPQLADAHRYNAACAAVLAGCGKGKDAGKLTREECARWRNQALRWLQAELAVRRRHLKSTAPAQAGQARVALEHWRRDPDMAGVRDRDQLARLPVEEGEAWVRLWMEVGEGLRESRP